jgi:hypothetical protein
MTALPMGFKYPESSTDSLYGRATFGFWAIEGRRLFIGPWLQSDESLAVEWNGIKRDWAESDIINTTTAEDSFPWGPDVQRAIRLFCQQDRPQDFVDGKALAAKWTQDWLTARADLMYECNKVTELQHTIDPRADVDGEMVDLDNLLIGYPTATEEEGETGGTTPTSTTANLTSLTLNGVSMRIQRDEEGRWQLVLGE